MSGIVLAVSRSPTHTFSKPNQTSIRLLAGLGVEGDAHMGQTVKHRSRVAADPTQPNLRQVHLIHAELHDELQLAGFSVMAGIWARTSPRGALICWGCLPVPGCIFGARAVVEVTGLRNPCDQLDQFQSGLKAAVLGRDDQGNLIRKAGVMGIVLASGEVHAGDLIGVELPQPPYRPLERV